MEERKYEVLVNDEKIASEMMIDDALLFIKAYFEKYYMEHDMKLSLREMQ